jgi:filamentous hemagglutinin family protein
MKTYRSRVLRRHPLALAVCCVLAGVAWPAPVLAQNVLPQGPSVRHGAATINTVTVGNGQHMVVDSRTPGSKQTFIDWRGFSISTGNSVRFEQPDAASLVVNRVLGGSESGIFGGLSSNGRVWLLNPYGIYFGAGSTINVGGLVASTLYADLESPGQLFSSKSLALYQDSSGEGPVGTITNLGTIKAGSGHVALISGGGGVLNYGTISNPDGRITLLAGSRVQVLDPGLPNLSFVLDPAHYRGAVVNSPYADVSDEVPTRSAATLEVGSGRVDMAAAIVNQTGIVRADAADGAGGTVDMRAHILTVPDGSVTSASGRQRGGEIRLQTVPLQEPLEGYWGDVAGRLLVEPKAELRADAVDRGNGGLIAIEAATAATVDGRLSAHGGKAGGDGGRIELSAHSIELRNTSVQASSTGGRPGVLSITSVADAALTERIAAPALVSGGSDPPLFYLRQPQEGDLLESRVRSGVVADALSGGTSVELRVERGVERSDTGNLYVGFGSPINTKEPVPMSLAVSHASAEPLSFTLAASGNLTLAQTSLLFDGRLVDVHLLAGAAPLRGGAAPLTSASAVLAGSRVISAGRISLGGQQVGLRSESYLSSSAAGDAIVIHGPDRRGDGESPFALGSAGRFINAAGAQALRSPQGRWLVYASSRRLRCRGPRPRRHLPRRALRQQPGRSLRPRDDTSRQGRAAAVQRGWLPLRQRGCADHAFARVQRLARYRSARHRSSPRPDARRPCAGLLRRCPCRRAQADLAAGSDGSCPGLGQPGQAGLRLPGCPGPGHPRHGHAAPGDAGRSVGGQSALRRHAGHHRAGRGAGYGGQ